MKVGIWKVEGEDCSKAQEVQEIQKVQSSKKVLYFFLKA